MSSEGYHEPVMLQECIDGMNIKPDGVYVDVTFGGGGHTRAILKHIENGKLYAFDQDEEARVNAEDIKESSFTLVASNFRYLQRYLKMYGITKIDGILADLGVSSHQIDDPERGFSTRFSADLDMRMDKDGPVDAKHVVNTYSEKELHRILGMYGEVRNAKTLAAAIIAARTNSPINTVDDLKTVLNKYAKRGKEFRYYAQVFQAIRIEVNEELKALEEMLEQATEMLSPGGRMVVMSYHSLEDRLVKNYMAKGKFHGEVEKDFYGNVIKPLQVITKKPVTASEEELSRNNRARSAKLRIAEKI